MRKLFFLFTAVMLFGACQLFHFFSPAVQNSIIDLSDSYEFVQVGQTFSNVAGSGVIPYSINVDANNNPYLVFQNNYNTIDLFMYSKSVQSWVLRSTNSAPNMMYDPVLNFSGTTPYIAYRVSGNPSFLYNFSTPHASYIADFFYDYPAYMDFVITPSGKQIVAGYQNNAGSNWVYIIDIGVSSNILLFTNTIDMISLEAAQDGTVFLLINFSAPSILYKLSGSSVVDAYPFEMSTFGISMAIDGANNIYTTYHWWLNTNSVYYDIRPLSDPALPVFYTKTFLEAGAVFNGKQGCAATKNAPHYFYTFAGVITPSETNISIMRLSPDENIRNVQTLTTNISVMMNYKMVCAPDGTLYVALAQNIMAINQITVWKLKKL